MCYSRCPYENYFGDCVIRDRWDGEKYRHFLDGVEIEHYPDDAHCVIADKAIEEEAERVKGGAYFEHVERLRGEGEDE